MNSRHSMGENAPYGRITPSTPARMEPFRLLAGGHLRLRVGRRRFPAGVVRIHVQVEQRDGSARGGRTGGGVLGTRLAQSPPVRQRVS